MSVNIRNPRVHELARQAAALTGETQTSVIERALVKLLEELEAESSAESRRRRVERILADIDRRSEPERDAMLTAIMESGERAMSAANWLESTILVDGRNDPVLSRRLGDLILAVGLEIEDVTPDQVVAAPQAYHAFGKGRRRASLNVGDCFAYALASMSNAPLLCKGDDFRHTDLQLVELARHES